MRKLADYLAAAAVLAVVLIGPLAAASTVNDSMPTLWAALAGLATIPIALAALGCMLRKRLGEHAADSPCCHAAEDVAETSPPEAEPEGADYSSRSVTSCAVATK